MINTINLPPFKRMCVTIGNLPSSFMESMSYYEALCWMYNYLDKTVIPAINTEGEAITELQTAFTTLKTYIDNYFDNLDVQEEINNKLDAMAEDGTLAEIINQEIFGELNEKIETLMPLAETTPAKIHFIGENTNNGDSIVIEIENNNMLVDMGISTYFNSLVAYLVGNNITKFKYFMISHYDADHANYNNFVSMLENQYLDFSECTFILPPQIDWSQTTGLTGQQTLESQITAYLLAHNYTIKYPQELEKITIDDNNFLKFYNCSSSFYNEYYTLEIDDAGNEIEYTQYNNFSLVCELNSCNKSILLTGDIMYNAEENIADEIEKIDVIKIPHHGVNRYAYPKLLEKCTGKIGVICSGAGLSPLRPYYQTLLNSSGKLFATNESGTVILSIYQQEITCKSTNGEVILNCDNIIKENDNLNSIIKDGVYYLNNEDIIATVSNLPYSYNSQCLLEVKRVTTMGIYQKLYTLSSAINIWVRKTTNGGTTWTQWKQITTNIFEYHKYAISERFQLSGNAFTKIPIDRHTIGYSSMPTNLITLDTTNHDLVIGEGVNQVEVGFTMCLTGVLANDRVMGAIYLNGNAALRVDRKIIGEYETLELNTILNVTKNDKISFYYRNLNTNSYITSETFSTEFRIKTLN